mgnify:CR=1 FL=1
MFLTICIVCLSLLGGLLTMAQYESLSTVESKRTVTITIQKTEAPASKWHALICSPVGMAVLLRASRLFNLYSIGGVK